MTVLRNISLHIITWKIKMQTEKCVKQEAALEKYQHAINSIDDYFEYRHESDHDKEFVMKTLDRLTHDLTKIYKTK